ncbi:MAG: 30S ribosomal protein S17 [Candidatus Omnitrophica bacterium]|nr:30S ribosomal protein S17 [Candidatus Omnitrophota bacterium]
MKGKRILEGIVLSDKMNKTIVVTVTTRVSHPSYDRTVIKRKKYKVHDEAKTAKIGDRVRIIESRPTSKEKRFTLLEVLK